MKRRKRVGQLDGGEIDLATDGLAVVAGRWVREKRAEAREFLAT